MLLPLGLLNVFVTGAFVLWDPSLRLLAILGQGEVDAHIKVLGPSHVWETAFPGVWLVEHRNTEDERLTLHIEISSVPEILRSQREDIVDAIARLDARLGPDAGITRPSPTTA
jgi:hypothetical protein